MRLGERKLGVVSGPRSQSWQVTQLESDPQGTTPHPLHCIRLHCSAPQCTVETLGSSNLDAHPLLTTSRSTQNLFRRPVQEARAGGPRLCPRQEMVTAKALWAFPEPRQLSPEERLTCPQNPSAGTLLESKTSRLWFEPHLFFHGCPLS